MKKRKKKKKRNRKKKLSVVTSVKRISRKLLKIPSTKKIDGKDKYDRKKEKKVNDD